VTSPAKGKGKARSGASRAAGLCPLAVSSFGAVDQVVDITGQGFEDGEQCQTDRFGQQDSCSGFI
jgi:hypothetical protein